MAKLDLFGASTFPVFAAYANGRSLGYLINYRDSDGWKEDAATVNIPFFGKRKIPIGEFIAGVVSVVISIFALLPLREYLLKIFFENFSLAEKWPTFVVVSSMISLVIISFLAGCKLLIKGIVNSKKVAEEENKKEKRDKETVDNLIK